MRQLAFLIIDPQDFQSMRILKNTQNASKYTPRIPSSPGLRSSATSAVALSPSATRRCHQQETYPDIVYHTTPQEMQTKGFYNAFYKFISFYNKSKFERQRDPEKDAEIKSIIHEMEDSGIGFLDENNMHNLSIADCVVRMDNSSDALEILHKHKPELLKFAQDLKKTSPGINTPLHAAAEYGQPAVVAYLIELGFDVNRKDTHGNTPIHCAAKNSNNEVLKYLCAQPGANVNSENDMKWTPLHTVCMQEINVKTPKNLKEKIRILRNHGANLEAADKRGQKPIHFAASRGAASGLGLIRELVQLGANWNSKDKDGNTVHHHAVRSNKSDSYEVIEGLLNLGIKNAHHKNNYGQTPRDIAQFLYPELVPILEHAEETGRKAERARLT